MHGRPFNPVIFFLITAVLLLTGMAINVIFLFVWTPFNKLGRIYGKEIDERAKKSPSFFCKKCGKTAWSENPRTASTQRMGQFAHSHAGDNI
jgi:hypothetical protein